MIISRDKTSFCRGGNDGPSPGSFGSFDHQASRQTLAVEFGHAIVDETLERLYSRQDDDCSRISLRMEY